jgi:HK97 family phage portal protein
MGIGLKILNALGLKKALSAGRSVQQYAFLTGLPVYNTANSVANINNGYVGNDDVYSVIRRIARTIAMIPMKVYKVVDDAAMKEYEFELSKKNYSTAAIVKQQFLKHKALELVDAENPLQKLLDNPNDQYSKTEFREGFHTFLLATGNTFVYAPSLEFGANAGKPAELWLSPTQYMSLQISDTWPRRVLGYKLQISEIINIPVEEMMHTRYFNPQYNYVGNELFGLSPLTAGSKILDRGDSETDYSVNSFQNSGISGIVYNESVRGEDIEDGALSKMKSDFYNEASGVTNARKLLFQAGKIGYTAIGLSPVDMDVITSMKLTFKKLCNLYGVSDRLFNNDATGSEISVDIAYKDLYTNAALPGAYAERDTYNMHLVPKYNTSKEKYFVDIDITGIAELQDDYKDMAAVYSQLPVMNPAVIGKAFGWDTDDIKDEWFIKTGYVPIDQAGGIEPLPIDTENGN